MNFKRNVILFDLDETLIIEYTSAQEALLTACSIAKNRYGVDPYELREVVFKEARKLWHQLPTYKYCRIIGISSWEALWAEFLGEHKKLKELRGLQEEYRMKSWDNALILFNIKNIQFAKELSDRFIEERRKIHNLFNDVPDILTALQKDYRLGIVTNGSPDLQMAKIKGGKLEDFFEYILISGDVNFGKPDKRIFKKALDRFNVKKESVIMVGDSIRTDIAGANNAGISSIWLNRSDKENETSIKPAATIKDLAELPEKLRVLSF